MPVRPTPSRTEDIEILDDDGTPFLDRNGAPCRVTIRSKPSQDAVTAYFQHITRFAFDPEGGVISRDVDYRAAEDALFTHGVVEWSGFEDDGGAPLPLKRWRELDPEVCRQFLQPLQAKMLSTRKAEGDGSPNGNGPSGASSKADPEPVTAMPSPSSSESGWPAS